MLDPEPLASSGAVRSIALELLQEVMLAFRVLALMFRIFIAYLL
jgi:hypothetical protein